MLVNLIYCFVTYEAHVHSTPFSPSFQQVGGVRCELTKGMPFYLLYKNKKIKKFVEFG